MKQHEQDKERDPADCMFTKFDELGVELLALRVEINRVILETLTTLKRSINRGSVIFLMATVAFLIGMTIGVSF